MIIDGLREDTNEYFKRTAELDDKFIEGFASKSSFLIISGTERYRASKGGYWLTCGCGNNLGYSPNVSTKG